jgi:hypothetical protein
MSDTLTQLTSKIQAALGDTGTYFTAAICTAAVRAALSEINERAPVHNVDLIIVSIANVLEYEVTDIDTRAMMVLDILKKDDNGEKDEPLKFDQYTEDARLFFRLRDALAVADTIIVRYTIQHTVNELDSATESTLPSMHDQYLVHGAAYHAILIRSVARTETINLQQDVSRQYEQLADNYRKLFDAELEKLSRQQAAVGEPRTDAWNDEWHGRSL